MVNPKLGEKYALRQIPVAAVTHPDALLVIAAGSEVDLTVLRHEVETLDAAGYQIRDRLWIDPAATVLEPWHVDQEADASLTARIGSTSKGIGAARAARIMRTAHTVDDQRSLFETYGRVQSTAHLLDRPHGTVQVEGTQGYGLGLHTYNYPQVTSSDCRAVDFMAMAGVSPWSYDELEIWVVLRPYPIRVAGNSGPIYAETTWEELGLEPEYTTVTKKMRRVGRWDEDLARGAIRANGGWGRHSPVHVAVTMLDQVDPAVAGVTDPEALFKSQKAVEFMDRVTDACGDSPEIATTSDRTWVDLRNTPPV